MIEASTFARGFRDAVSRSPDVVAVRTRDGQLQLTYLELATRVDALAGGLAELGLRRGDTLALMLSNRPEFHVADLAAVTLGAVPFSIYQTLAPEQIAYVVADAGARVAIVEAAYLEPFLAARRELPNLEHLIVVDAAAGGDHALDDVERLNPDFDGEAAALCVEPQDLLTLIYTSGTTGPPKGVQISHANSAALIRAFNQVMPLRVKGRVISWLPTAHIAERNVNYYIPMLTCSTITCCADARQIGEVLPEVRPDFFFAVPRIWQKIKAGLEARLLALPGDERAKVQAALDAGREKVGYEQARKAVPKELASRVAEADVEVFAPMRKQVGFDELRFSIVGAAPTPPSVIEFFHAIGVPVAECWGMSETTAGGTINPPAKARIGSVGPPYPGVEIKLAADGEVLVRGEIVMVGYRNQPEKTAETIDADGWLHSGDIGELDADGYLTLVDRKKELIINASGKNMSPSNIESTLKGACPLIGQMCVIGDARPFNTALIVLDPDSAAAWAAANGLGDRSYEELATEPKVVAAVEAGIDEGNARLARVEGVKKFTLLPADWPPAGDELTPTMKLKRKPIATKYQKAIEEMYEEQR